MRKLLLATVVALGMIAGFEGHAAAQWMVPFGSQCMTPMGGMGWGYQAPIGMGWANPYQAPMDMSWAIESQMRLQQCGDQTALNIGGFYLGIMNDLRTIYGYTGPSLPTGVTPQTLHDSIEVLNRQYEVNNWNAARNGDITSRAIGNWDERAIRGCFWTYDAYGRPLQVCP